VSSRIELRIHGMDCADEVAILRRAIEPMVKAPERLSFDILRGKMNVDAGTPAVTEAELSAAVAKTGMRAEIWRDEKPPDAEIGFWQRRGRTVLMVASGGLAAAAFAIHAAQDGFAGAIGIEGTGIAESSPPPVAVALYIAGILAGGWHIAPRAVAAVRRLRPDMNFLMTIAVIGAAAIGEWFEAGVVTFLFAFSLALESWSVGRARRAVEALMANQPATARLLSDRGPVTAPKGEDVAFGA